MISFKLIHFRHEIRAPSFLQRLRHWRRSGSSGSGRHRSTQHCQQAQVRQTSISKLNFVRTFAHMFPQPFCFGIYTIHSSNPHHLILAIHSRFCVYWHPPCGAARRGPSWSVGWPRTASTGPPLPRRRPPDPRPDATSLVGQRLLSLFHPTGPPCSC